MRKYVDLGHWITEVRTQAQRDNNTVILRSLQLHDEGWRCREAQPQRALALWREAQQLAETDGHNCLTLFHWYWCAEAYLFYLTDIQSALAETMRMVVEIRKPQYELCPLIGQIYRIMIDTYLFIDPLGYADQIAKMTTYLEQNVPIDENTHCLLMHRYSLMAYERDDRVLSLHWANQYLQMSLDHREYSARVFFSTNSHLWLTYLYYLADDYATALQHCREGERFARLSQRTYGLMMALFWQAYLLRQSGNEAEATRLYQAAEFQLATIDMKTGTIYYEVRTAYHVCREEWETAKRWLERGIAEMQTTGELYEECKLRMRYACLLGQMKLPVAPELANIRELVQKLKIPTCFDTKLERIAQGNYDEKLI